MSYQVLARKWRPRTFSEMVGQEHVLQALVNGLDNDRLHHAYLFTGTRGVGKTTLARIIAKCLNCEQGVSATPCGQCSACVAISEGRFVDLLEVDAASRTKVEDTRELLENVQYLPTNGRYKVYLIDEVHMLSNHSFNALLKTLEEPPPHVKFLLATTDPQKLPVTILSRCLQFNLKNLNPERIVGHLKHVLEQEQIPYEEPALWSLGRAADGSMRDALSLTDQAIAHGGGQVTEADVNAMLGNIDLSAVEDICVAVSEGRGQDALALVDQLADHAPDYSDALAEMLSLWHRVAIAQTAPDALDHSQRDHGTVLALSERLSREDVQLFYQITLLGRRDLPHAADPRSGFEMVILRLLAFQPVPAEYAERPLGSPKGTDPGGAGGGSLATGGNSAAPQGVARDNAPVSLSQDASESVAVQPPQGHGTSSGEVLPWESEPESHPKPAAVEAAAPPKKPEAPPAQANPVDALRQITDAGEPEPAPVGACLQANDSGGEVCSPARQAPTGASSVETEVVSPTGPTLAGEPSARAGQSDVSSATPPPVDLEQLAPEHWIGVYRSLNVGGLVQNTAANLVLDEREGNTLRFTMDSEFSSLYDDGHQQRLAQVLCDYFGTEVQVEIQVGEVSGETPRCHSQRIRAERLAEAVASLRGDPHVNALIQQFGGELLEHTVEPLGDSIQRSGER